MKDLERIAERTAAAVTKLGASACDVLVVDARSISADIEKGSVKQANTMFDAGVAVRAFDRGCSGFAYCTGHDEKDIARTGAMAYSQACAGTPDPHFKGLLEASPPTPVGGLFDQGTFDMQAEEVVELLIQLAESAAGDDRVVSVNASTSVASGEFALANSNGFVHSQKMTSYDMMAEAVARSGEIMFSGIEFDAGRRFRRDAIDAVGGHAKEQAIQGLAQSKISSGDYPIIMDSMSIGYILGAAVGGGLNAENTQRNRSYLSGRLGERIGSELLSVRDDPTLEWAQGSYSFDGEGCPAKSKVLIDSGRVKSYLYDSYTAGKDSMQSTSNASRGGAIWSFRHPPEISPSNLVVKEGDSSLEEMIRETNKGVYLRLTFDRPNLATGEFSGLMMESYLIDGGEVGPSIRQATLGIGLMDMFSRIDMVGRESRDAFGVITPPVRISSARVAGSG